MTSCTWSWGAQPRCGLRCAERNYAERALGQRLARRHWLPLEETGELNCGGAHRSDGSGAYFVRGSDPLALGWASPLMGDARALRGVVGLRGFLCCGSRSPDTLRPDRAALTDPDSLTRGH